MTVTGQTWTFFAGDECVIGIASIPGSDGDPVDLTGRIVRFALAPYNSQGVPIYSSPVLNLASDDSPASVTIPNPTGGTTMLDPHVRLTLSPAQTAPLATTKAKSYYVEAEVLEGDLSSKVTILTGKATFSPTVDNS